MTDYQLMLPHLAAQSTDYSLFYNNLCRDPEQYVILDNGAAEGEMVNTPTLLEVVRDYKPDELVLPDVIGDSVGTVAAIHKFMEATQKDRPNCKLGFVAAGKDKDEALKTVLSVLESFSDELDVIYIPRSLVTKDAKHARLELASDIVQITDKPIHFLGTNPLWIEEVKYAGVSEMVRGVDTSAPFNYAAHGAWIFEENMHVKRPDGYFNYESHMFDKGILGLNITRILEWTYGTYDD